MRYRERLNIIFMRDNGPRRSISMRRSRFYLLIAFFLCLPFLTLLLTLQCWFLWEENTTLRENIEKFEIDCQNAEQRAEKLEHLEALLQEENVTGREILLRQLARDEQPLPDAELVGESEQIFQDGPGHEEYPVIDTGRVKVENVQIRARRGHTLRLGMDIRNPENSGLICGMISATLVTSDGNRASLNFAPQGVENFRINRFKRAVMTTRVPANVNLVNASVILEVREQNGDILYQNIYDLQR